MNKQVRLIHPLIKLLNNLLIDLPTPKNISYWWNFGSLLGMCLILQILTGLFLTIHYSANVNISFDSVIHICRDVNFGWLIRTIHANGASIFFILVYLHIGRGIYYSSFKLIPTWTVGVIILFILIGTAFIGYVLPWGQISFWGATVITNLLSAIPYIGFSLVEWIWGGFGVNNATLTRFLTLHFLIPFIIVAIVIIHIMFLHQTGSNNPLGLKSNISKISFHPFFSYKDVSGGLMFLLIFIFLTLRNPYILRDPDNFTPSNPIVTPPHIQPEWYFLFAYAILRSIPNKLGGVIALLISIAILIFIPLFPSNKFQSRQFYPIEIIRIWIITISIILLTWIGACPVEVPYILSGQILSIIYFSSFFLTFINKKWDNCLN